MASLRVFGLLLVAVFYVTIVDGAAVRPNVSEDSSQTITKDQDERFEREATTLPPSTPSDGGDCGSQACGWAIYKQWTRQIQSFISNTCICTNPNSRCIRTEDDISVSAYVYHCRHNFTEDDILAPANHD